MADDSQKTTNDTPPLPNPEEVRKHWPERKKEIAAITKELKAGVTRDNYQRATKLQDTLGDEGTALALQLMSNLRAAQQCAPTESPEDKAFIRQMKEHDAKLSKVVPHTAHPDPVDACEATLKSTGKAAGDCQAILREDALLGLSLDAEYTQHFIDVGTCMTGNLSSGAAHKGKKKEAGSSKQPTH